jgi:hypothetical protein
MAVQIFKFETIEEAMTRVCPHCGGKTIGPYNNRCYACGGYKFQPPNPFKTAIDPTKITTATTPPER